MGGTAVLGVPIDSVGGRVGTAFMPEVLRAAGLIGALGARDLGDLDVMIEATGRDPSTGIVGSDSVLSTTGSIRDAVIGCADPGTKLVILGGCCTLAVGVIAGYRRRFGRLGVVYLDGHMDLYDGKNSPTGEAADMPLAVALGAGPGGWADAAGDAPLLRPRDVALLGFRDLEEAAGLGSITPDDLPGITAMDTPSLLSTGMEASALLAAEAVGAAQRKFAVFADLDILDESVFPNDAPVPGGLGWDQLAALLRPLVGNPFCLGISIACYNPERDPDRVSAEKIVELLKDVVPA